MPVRFFLVSRPEDAGWPLILSQALAPLGMLEVASEADAAERIVRYRCRAVVILDAARVEDVPALISHLRERCPESPVVVATASPTWQHARDAFRAGAVDYIRRSWDRQELLNAMKEILKNSGPPGPESRSEKSTTKDTKDTDKC